MTEDIKSDTAKARAEEASKQGTFNFLDRLMNRNYPTQDLVIYLDEGAGHDVAVILDKIGSEQDPEKANLLFAELDAAKKRAEESMYTLHMQGISNEEYDAVVDAAKENFPVEYNESRNPLTMALEREEIPSPEREQFFRTHLWSKFIKSVEDAQGNIDDNITPEWIATFLNHAPSAAISRLINALTDLRMVTDWMDVIQGPDFLAKS